MVSNQQPAVLMTHLLVLLLLLQLAVSDETPGSKDLQKLQPPEPAKDCQPQDQRCLLDQRAFEAISRLHSLLDDDKNGAVDAAEADGFAREELAYGSDFERAGAINQGDPSVSTRELWSLWRASEAHNWTVDDVCNWAEHQVGLPELSVAIRELGIDGAHLPLLAEPSFFLQQQQQQSMAAAVLRALSPAQRRRLAIKAMDVVLFGPPKKAHNMLKDALLAVLLCVIPGVAWLVAVQRPMFEEHRRKVLDQLDNLKIAENSLANLQRKLSSAEKQSEKHRAESLRLEQLYKLEIGSQKNNQAAICRRRHMSPAEILSEEADQGVAEEDASVLRQRLADTERELQLLRARQEQRPVVCGAELQRLLQLSYEAELRYCNANRQKAEKQLMKASGGLERLRRRQYSLIGLFRNAFDSAETVGHVEQDIISAKDFTEKVKLDFQEHLLRWSQIEQLVGFDIVSEQKQSRGLNIRPYATLWKQKTTAKFKRSATLDASLFAKQSSVASMHDLLNSGAGRGCCTSSVGSVGDSRMLAKRGSAPCMQRSVARQQLKADTSVASVSATAAGSASLKPAADSLASAGVTFSLPSEASGDRSVPASSPPRMGTHSLQQQQKARIELGLSRPLLIQQLPPPPPPELESPISLPPHLEEEELSAEQLASRNTGSCSASEASGCFAEPAVSNSSSSSSRRFGFWLQLRTLVKSKSAADKKIKKAKGRLTG